MSAISDASSTGQISPSSKFARGLIVVIGRILILVVSLLLCLPVLLRS